MLVERDSPPRRLLAPLLSRIKIMGSHRHRREAPAPGRPDQDDPAPASTSTCASASCRPSTASRWSCVSWTAATSRSSIRDLGFGEDDYKRFQSIIKRPNGIFLVTGPTGSGKTTTLYAALNELNRPDRKIITAEDPVEYYLPGINQVEVKHQIGLDFARIIRAMLRQAPNIILVGEIRDKETAEIAVQASLTGHLVFSTLHTNDAPSAITRLIDIGVPPFLVASSRHRHHGPAARAGRLPQVQGSRTSRIKAEMKAAGLTPDQIAGATFMRGRGCNHCHHTGYRGRLGIFEMLRMNPAIREMTFNRSPTQEIRRQARVLGMRTLLEDGVDKAAARIGSRYSLPPHHRA